MPHLSVNDRREPVFSVALDVLPHVQHRAARRVDEHTAGSFEALHFRRGHAERGQHDDVARAEVVLRAGVAQKPDAEVPQPVVHVRVVNDFAGEKNPAIGKPLARLIRIIDGAIDAITEAELACEMQGEPAGLIKKAVGLDFFDELAVIVLVELGRDRLFQVEPFSENQRRGHVLDRSRARRKAHAASGGPGSLPFEARAGSSCRRARASRRAGAGRSTRPRCR